MDIKSKLSNKKIMLGTGALLSMIAIIVVMSIFPFVIDPSRIWTWDWWVDEIFIIVIVIYCVTCTLFIGQASNGSDANSQIAKARKKFIAINEHIVRDPFEQWVEQVLEPRDQEKVYKRVLREVGVKQWSVIDLPRKDIKSLLNTPQRIDQIWYDELTEEQIEVIMKIKDGDFNIKFVDPSYYLTDKNVDIEYTRSERATRENRTKNKLFIKTMISKVLMVLIVGVVFGMFTKDLLAGEQDKSVVFFKLFSRLLNVCSSSYVGFLLGCQLNDVNAAYIEMKSDTQKEFFDDKDFKPMSIEEKAKQKFANKLIKDQEQILLLNGDEKANE